MQPLCCLRSFRFLHPSIRHYFYSSFPTLIIISTLHIIAYSINTNSSFPKLLFCSSSIKPLNHHFTSSLPPLHCYLNTHFSIHPLHNIEKNHSFSFSNMPALFFKHARTKNTPKNPEKPPPVEPSQQDIYNNLERIQTKISYNLVESATLRKWITVCCPKLTPYGIVPPPVAVVDGLPSLSGYMLPPTSADSFWSQDTSMQTIQTLVYFLSLESANMRKWIEELCNKTPFGLVLGYEAPSTSADRA